MASSPPPPPQFSPSSDKRFWSTLRSRVDTLLDVRQPRTSSHSPKNVEGKNQLKEDSMLLMRGFDSVANTLSMLSNNLDNALQGARELGNPPTLTDIFHSKNDKVENKEDSGEKQKEESKQGMKRKLDNVDYSEESAVESQKENGKKAVDRNIKKAKNLAVSMATKAASLARELKSIKSDLCFMQERCGLLEEENRRLRDGFAKGVRPEEDDLVRLQLEALLAEKSRLANENANLVRENQCLHQLVEYHQLASQDLSESDEDSAIQGTYLDFSSPPPTIPEEAGDEEGNDDDDDDENGEPHTPTNDIHKFSASLDDAAKY
ncbi:uncharacterized protein LOC106757359 [Vigna radiata var. radiata]|uniref:Uncharacterized protein LOC106757359 n=1 Tax=Vigna radiata var. radiata TaxID=3916 RepID=A0A1S3TP14_VIGRR|nr:uncharacterized protein LOC106757359 [Vigna radiata var. radiata]XP_022634799.1 uncharacterized protein LOC106757359 [Vigna radiata var. radiata]